MFGFSNAWALNESPQTYTLDGQLYQAGTKSPLMDAAAKIKIQILNPNGTCLLYEEQQTVDTISSGGRFTIHVGSATGSAKRTVNDPGRTMNQVFQNMSAITANSVPGQTCASGFYTPTVGDVRYFRITVTPSTTNAPDTLTPDIAIDSVPQATIAQSVQGLERSGILQTNSSGSTVLTQANLEALFTTPAYTNLQSILAGNFMKTDSSGASLPSYAANPAGASTGDIWFDSTTNQIKYQTSGGVQTVGAAGGGSISSLTVGSSMSLNGSVAGTISTGSGTIDLTNTGITAGTYTKLTVDAKGRATAGTVSLVEADIPNLTTAGKVSGNTITSGTISGSASINTTGNLITTGTISGLNVQATNVRIYNGANYVQLAAPALGGNVNLTLPTTDGNPNEFLKTDGSGVLSWASASITSSDVTAALGYTPLNAAATFSGDVSGVYSNISVDKIKGKALTAATVSGQMMIYDGSSWVNSVVSGDATLAYDGTLSLNKVPVSKGGTNATTFGNNRIIASNGTGTALIDFSCSLNQVISFDASGNAVCAAISSLGGYILNGGNTTGADISIGTNDNKALNFKTNNTIAMTISQGGFVGIGTSMPSTPLEVVTTYTAARFQTTQNGNNTPAEFIATSGGGGFANIPYVRLYNSNGANGSGMGLFFAGKNSNPQVTNIAGIEGRMTTNTVGNHAGILTFGTTLNGSAITERMRIAEDGSVGIGVTNPSSALDISGAVTTQGLGSAPSVSSTNSGRIYFDTSTNKFKVSQNGAAYVDLVSTGGITSLGGQTGATQTLAISVDNSVATPTISSATDAHTWKIPMASNTGTTAGLLNKTDYDSFVAKLGTTTSFAGDVSGTYNATSVDKIKGKAVTAASISGQMMIYNGTAWNNAVMSGDATMAYDGIFTLNKVPVSKGGTNVTSFGNNRIIASNGTGTALQDFSCSLNQVITFDASGNSACANISSIFAGIVNGGNSTGAAISIGTNDNYSFKLKANNNIAMTIMPNGDVQVGSGQITMLGTANINIGIANSVSYNNSMAVGRGNTTGSADTSIAVGIGNAASRDSSALFGSNNYTNLNGYYSMLFGRGNASGGSYGVAIGNNNTISADGAIAVGNNITNSTANSAQIGPSDTAKLTILSSGSVGIGTSTPAGILDVEGGTTSAANGTAINIVAQTTTKASSNGGDINITAGAGTNAGGAVILKSGTYGPYTPPTITLGGQQSLGANISVVAGNNDVNASPGTLLLSSGASANGGGGSVTLTSGAGGNATSGNIYIVPGNTGAIGTGNVVLGMASDSSVRGKVGIGTASPTAKLEVSGQVVSKTYNNGSATTFDFANGNAQYTTASCGAMTLQNMVDGGAYTIAVQGATAGTCTFTDSAGSRTFKFSPANGPSTASSHTLYSMQVMGSYVYVSWISGF